MATISFIGRLTVVTEDGAILKETTGNYRVRRHCVGATLSRFDVGNWLFVQGREIQTDAGRVVEVELAERIVHRGPGGTD